MAPDSPLPPSLLGVIELFGRLLATDDQEEHLDVLVEGAIEILRADSGYLVRRVDDRLVFYRRWGAPTGKSEPVSRAIVTDALESPHAILVGNASLDSRYALRESVQSSSLRSVLAARVDTDEPVVLYLESSNRQLGDEHLELFQRIVDFSSSTLQRSADALQRSQTQELFERFDFHGIVARDQSMLKVLEVVSKVAAADYPVLIEGPTGAGKELVARAIHRNSRRRKKPLVVMNCGAISPSLLESELFGRTSGAFTGADDAQGLVRSADGGTLLLDEIGDLPLKMQVKLLRTLQFGEVKPVGVSETKKVDVRFLASTNRSLPQEVDKGAFRNDLLQRLNTLTVTVPALTKRPADVVPLFLHFLDQAAKDQGVAAPELTPEATRCLLDHHWEGNVRELGNEAKRTVVLNGSKPVTAAALSFVSETLSEEDSADGPESLEASERALILQHLTATRGNRSAAAKALGISREGLRKKMIRLKIKYPPD